MLSISRGSSGVRSGATASRLGTPQSTQCLFAVAVIRAAASKQEEAENCTKKSIVSVPWDTQS